MKELQRISRPREMPSLYAIRNRVKNRTRTFLHRFETIYQFYSSIKGPLEERDVARSLRYYRAEAAKKGVAFPKNSELRVLIRHRLDARGIVPVAKPKGALHLFLAFPMALWESAFPKILAPFGKVTVFEWRSLGFDDTSPGWLKIREVMNKQMFEAFEKANAEQPVDVVFGYLSGHNTNPEILLSMARRGAVIMNMCMDDKGDFPGPKEGDRYRSPAGIAAAVDLNLTTSPESVVKYLVHGGLALFWPPAADPTLHKPYNLTFEFDVSFVGGKYCWRPTFIRRLQEMGIDARAFGPGWENGAVFGENLIKLYSRSRVNLGFSAVGNSRNVRYLKIRDFEIPMSGGLLLTQNNPELSSCYEIEKEILVFEDEFDCARKIRWVLDHPREAAKIREAGRRRALRDHAWEKRFSDIFQLAGLLKPSAGKADGTT